MEPTEEIRLTSNLIGNKEETSKRADIDSREEIDNRVDKDNREGSNKPNMDKDLQVH